MSEKYILENWKTFRKVTTDNISHNAVERLFNGKCKYCKSIDLVQQDGQIHCAECGRTQPRPKGQNINAIGPYVKSKGQNMNQMRGWN